MTYMVVDSDFHVGDIVEKVGGSYMFSGEIVSVFSKRTAAIRYVVEDRKGVLRIYSSKCLRKIINE